MADFAARAALAGLAAPGHHGRAGTGLVIVERTGLSFANVIAKRGKRPALATAVDTAYGIALPDCPKRASRDGVTFAGTGPDQWLASAENVEGFATKLRGRIGLFAAVTDQSDSRTVLHLSGPRVRDVLAKGVPVDLHPDVFKAGDVASTLVAYVGVQLDRLDEATYQLAAPRSMAGTIWSWLTASAAEFGYDVSTK